jgi:hypothetical protein
MTMEDQAIGQLVEIHSRGGVDRENDHGDADKVLCDLLTSLGYGRVVEAWEKVEKWYA